MSRRWSTNQSKSLLPSLVAFQDFSASLPPGNHLQFADAAKVYSAYSALFAKGYTLEVKSASDNSFVYLQLQRAASRDVPGPAVEPIVPLSTCCDCFSPATMHHIFGVIEHPGYFKLAFVDHDGTATISKAHNYIQAPTEKITVAD